MPSAVSLARHTTARLLTCWALVAGPGPAVASAGQAAPPIAGVHIERATGKIVVDGDLSDDGWKKATRIDKWYETNPGDNIEPPVRSVGMLAYDDKFFYAAFEFDDPSPSAIRAPYGDRDNVPSFTDYGGVIIDARNDGKTAVLMLANPRGIQYDATQDDGGAGEDSSPDFYWDSAARINDHGWTLEIRIPFSSLRYRHLDPQQWGIMLFRNYPRDRRHMIFSTTLPRGGNCFICRSNALTGLSHLPTGGHLVAAPYASASQTATAEGDPGSPLASESVKPRAGIDVKYIPTANDVFDATVRPDFSQVEADTAQISANERFALFFPEKRPFFLEGVSLFSTPIQAVYTRSITDPRWGAHATGNHGSLGYTALVADDAGGGSVILPGPNGSSLADQDFSSLAFIGRARMDIGRSFVSLLLTDRESGADGHNRVVGPDFQWRHSDSDFVTGQLLFSDTRTPNRPDAAPEWTGQSLSSAAGDLMWVHSTRHYDAFAHYRDFGDDFRADSGFVPQVGFRDIYGETGYTVFPKGFLSRLRMFLIANRQSDRDGRLISSEISPGAGMDGPWDSFLRFRYANDEVRSGDQTFPRQQFVYVAQAHPPRYISQVTLTGYVGQEIDFENSRPGRGATVNLEAVIHPFDHLEISLLENHQWLSVDDAAGVSRQLFHASVSRVRATYNFTSRSFVRVIGQYVAATRDLSLYLSPVTPHDGAFTGSALFAYKLNWQSVLFIGYGDSRELTTNSRLAPVGREFFTKISYAFQR